MGGSNWYFNNNFLNSLTHFSTSYELALSPTSTRGKKTKSAQIYTPRTDSDRRETEIWRGDICNSYRAFVWSLAIRLGKKLSMVILCLWNPASDLPGNNEGAQFQHDHFSLCFLSVLGRSKDLSLLLFLFLLLLLLFFFFSFAPSSSVSF